MGITFNATKIQASLDEIGRSKDQLISRILDDTSKFFLSEINKKVPVDTGKYKQSWKVLSKSGNTVKVGTNEQKLFVILEFGTSGHIIEGNPVLKFKIGGVDFFRRSVDHPGIEPIRHFRPAVERTKKQLPVIVKKVVSRFWKMFKR